MLFEQLSDNLKELGFPEDWCKAMVTAAKESEFPPDELPYISPAEALYSFVVWTETSQGHYFWKDVCDFVDENGVKWLQYHSYTTFLKNHQGTKNA